MTDPDFNLYQPQPLLVVISGPSGVGKDSVVNAIRDRGLPFQFVVTVTTRPKRSNETEGVDYYFTTTEEFAAMRARGELIESAIVYKDLKGIPRKGVRAALQTGRDVLLRVDVQGAAAVRSMAPEALLIFLTTRSEKELVERLKKRPDAPADLSLRIATARQELKRADEFDYVVVNADGCLDETVCTVLAIIEAEHHRVNHRKVSL